jgi:peptidyl-prolyl cis-trans isomerase D
LIASITIIKKNFPVKLSIVFLHPLFKKSKIMAVIGQIRKKSGLLIVVVGVALAAFVLGDFLTPTNQGPRMFIGEVDGKDIPIMDFNTKVDQRLDATRSQRQTEKLSPQDIYQTQQSVWNEMVEEIILDDEFKSIGLNVTTEELSDQIIGANPHSFVRQSFTDPNTGTFDQQSVINFLRNLENAEPDMRRRYLNLETMVKNDRGRTKYKNLLTKGYFMPDAFAETDHLRQNKSAEIVYTAARFSEVADSLVTVTDKNLKKYYDENIQQYSTEKFRAIDFVIFDVQPSDEDRKQIANTVNKIYDEFSEVRDIEIFVNSVSDQRYDSAFKNESELPARIAEEMFNSPIGTIVGPYIENEVYNIVRLIDKQARPDSIQMSQLLISYATAPAGQDISDRTKEEAEQLIDSLFTVLNKNPEKFEELAVSFSDFPSAAEDKGELGWVMDNDPGMALFYNNGLNVETGDVAKMESALGFHVVKVTEKTRLVEKVRVATITRAIAPSSETTQSVYMEASRFAGEYNTLAKFNQAVEDQGLNKRTADRLSPMSNRIAGVEFPRQIIRWAYSERVSIGTVSPVFEDDGKYIVATLTEILPEGTLSFEDVKEQIRPTLLNQKKGEYLSERINALGTTNLNEIAAEMNSKVDSSNITFSTRNLPGYGIEYKLIGKILTLEEGVSSGPIIGASAVFVVEVKKFTEATPPDNYASSVRLLESRFASRISSNTFINVLKEDSEIVDNRILFY